MPSTRLKIRLYIGQIMSGIARTRKKATIQQPQFGSRPNILFRQRLAAISVGSVAGRCQISPGNATYDFKPKGILFSRLAKFLFERWSRRFCENFPDLPACQSMRPWIERLMLTVNPAQREYTPDGDSHAPAPPCASLPSYMFDMWLLPGDS